MSIQKSRGIKEQLLGLIFVTLILNAGGCGQAKYPLIKVSGTVTFDGKTCPASGSVTFRLIDLAEGLPKRPATGQFTADGRYSVNTYSHSKGVLPGRYLVEVTCFAGAPDLSKPDPWGAVNFIAEEYEPTEFTINADAASLVYDIDVPLRKK